MADTETSVDKGVNVEALLEARKSALIDGAGDGARDLSDHLASYLALTRNGLAG